MNICIAGKNNIAVEILSKIIIRYPEASVYVICNKNDLGIDGFQRSLKKFADENNVEIISLEDAYKIENLIFLSLEFDKIIRPQKFLSNKLFNIHFSLLPQYRGMFTSALPILNGEDYTGVTLHLIDSGIDTGDIIDQVEFKLGKNETAKTLYTKYISYGINLVLKNLDSIIKGLYVTKKQDIQKATYFSKKTIDYSNLVINYNTTAYQIDNQIRAFNFRNYQLAQYNGCPIVATAFTNNKSSFPSGHLISEDDYSFTISTIDYDIILCKDNFEKILNLCKQNNIEELKKESYLEYFVNESETVHGWTPLMVAAYNNSFETVAYLLSLGADPNAINFNGTSVLMYAKDGAYIHNDLSIIDELFKFEVNPYIRDYKHKTVLDYTKEHKDLYNYIKLRMNK